MTQSNTPDAPAVIDPGFRRDGHKRSALLNVAVEAGHLRRASTSSQIDRHTSKLSNLIERSLDNPNNSRRVETTREYLLHTLNKCPLPQRGSHLETAALALLIGNQGAHESVAPAGILYTTTALWPSQSKSQSGLALVYASSGDQNLALDRALMAQDHARAGWKLNTAELMSLLRFEQGDFQGVIDAVKRAVSGRTRAPADGSEHLTLARLYLTRCYAEMRLGLPMAAFKTLTTLSSSVAIISPSLRRIKDIYTKMLVSFLRQGGAGQSLDPYSAWVRLKETGSQESLVDFLPGIEAIYEGHDPRNPSHIFQDPFQSVQVHEVVENVLHQGDTVLTVGATQYEFSLPQRARPIVTTVVSPQRQPVRSLRRDRRGRWPRLRDLLPMAARILVQLGLRAAPSRATHSPRCGLIFATAAVGPKNQRRRKNGAHSPIGMPVFLRHRKSTMH